MRSTLVVAAVLLSKCCDGAARAQVATAPPAQSADWVELGGFTTLAGSLDWRLESNRLSSPVVSDDIVGQPDAHAPPREPNLSIDVNTGLHIGANHAFADHPSIEKNVFQLSSRSEYTVVESCGKSDPSDPLISSLHSNAAVRPRNQGKRSAKQTWNTSYTEDPAREPQDAAQPAAAFNNSSYWSPRNQRRSHGAAQGIL